ncbi:endo-beta-N-acetylglucosaminidase [Trypanosoma grayi]|uniref:endo-beta-N-acetylglucosaminidase n=1 Tax=Trypanosoma grayi TaxID=71804 RepID=UPI0004F415A3|nr:endo-beta-N-acetylglucosaminidase [Trypanosoma grayi]KEG08367.1 endo-beta-N-acetylglucosaminidase [Trypanosoma grayi]
MEGIWHTAVVVYGKEFYFDGGTGIVHEAPGRTRFGSPRRVESLGTTTKGEAEFVAWTQQQRRSGFGPYDYNLLTRNCNHFTQEAAQFLLGRDIPDDIRNMIPMVLDTPLGRMLRPMLESMTTASGAVAAAPQPTRESGRPAEPLRPGLHSTKTVFTVDEEEDIQIACAMLQSNELLSAGNREGFDVTLGALELLRTALRNIVEHPTESKYRGLSTNSQSYVTKLLPLEEFGAVELLHMCGFRLRQHPSGTGQQWYLDDDSGSADILSIMISRLSDLIEAVEAEAPSPAPEAAAEGKSNANAQTLQTSGGALSPEELEETESGERQWKAMQRDAGHPLKSLDELLNWSAKTDGSITPAVPCRRRVSAVSQQSRLLVCHDMRGGYLPGDYAHFALCDTSSAVEPVVDNAYTVNYWHLFDYFVYFAHHRVSIPPKEWINAAHRQGVPVLGTFITEGDGLDVRMMVHDAKKMGAVIHQLVELCNAYNFDGYLINIESNIDTILASRLVMFVSILRQKLNKRRPPYSCERSVVWYDAVTVDGVVQYQNALTVKNKAFFDVSNGIFTNYSWNTMCLSLSKVLADSRALDVYVGVDVFGRSRMYGGGGYGSDIAAECATKLGLSVALFAPGWTLEEKGKGLRETFLHANGILWSKLQRLFNDRWIECDTLPAWTCFRSGVGKQFYVNGERVVGSSRSTHPAEWCQMSQAHFTPCYQFAAGSTERDPWCVLPLHIDGKNNYNGSSKHDSVVPVEWTGDAVWMGDRSLSFVVPCGGAVTLLQWRVHLDKSKISSGGGGGGAVAYLDVVWRRDADGGRWRRVRVEGVSGSSTTQVVFGGEGSAGGAMRVIASVSDWELVRYVISADASWSQVTSVAVLNASTDKPLRCTIGGIAFAPPHNGSGVEGSVLLAGKVHQLPATAFHVKRTRHRTIRLVRVEVPSELQQFESVLVFATIGADHGASVRLYVGQHVVEPIMWVALHLPPIATVQELVLRSVSAGS